MRSLLPLIQKGMTGLNMTFLSFLLKNSKGPTCGAGKSGKMVQKKVSRVLIQVTVSVASQLLAIYTSMLCPLHCFHRSMVLLCTKKGRSYLGPYTTGKPPSGCWRIGGGYMTGSGTKAHGVYISK